MLTFARRISNLESDVLLYANVSVVDCYNALQAYNFTVDSSMLCTNTTNYTNLCLGDSGGPVTCASGGTTYLADVVITGIEPCSQSQPINTLLLNTYVSAFTDTINAAISNGVASIPSPISASVVFLGFASDMESGAGGLWGEGAPQIL